MNSKKLKISFVGVGFFSQISHLTNYYQNKNVELFEVCDLDLKLAKKVKEKFGFSGKCTNNYKNLSLDKTDAVVIILQRRLTENIAEYFLKKGCNVFTEKPSYYSSNKYLKMKKNQKGIWIKGYTRRWDKSLIFLKKNYNQLSCKLGNLISANYTVKNGESYLGAKHFVKPFIEKKIKSELSKMPNFIKKKYIKLYDYHLNSACHFIDIFDFFNCSLFENIDAEIDEKIFHVKFNTYYNKKKILGNITISSSKVKTWYEKMELDYEYGNIKILFNAPMFKKRSHKIIIENGITGKTLEKYFKYKWSFKEQVDGFIDLIKIKKKHFNINSSSDGYAMIKNYENIWKSFQTKAK